LKRCLLCSCCRNFENGGEKIVEFIEKVLTDLINYITQTILDF
jgi:hypothetical protein